MRARASLILFSAILTAAAANAASKLAPNAAIARIGPADATSRCIGDNATQNCAAETLLACFARADASLCRKVGVADARGIPREPGAIEYVIERVSVIRAADVTDDLRDLEWFKPGYALVEIIRRLCRDPAACGDEPWEELQVFLRPVDGRWEVVAWRGEIEPDALPEIPDISRGAARP